MKKTSTGWHVLYVKSQHEKRIDVRLKELNLDSFLPLVTTMRQWSDRKKKIQKPLFPSYIFLYVNSKKDFYKALDIEGVFKYLSYGECYATVKAHEITRIKQLLRLEGFSDMGVTNNIPKVGEKMMINFGPLNGLQCQVVRANNRNKVFVKIESIRQIITAHVPNSYLSPLNRVVIVPTKKTTRAIPKLQINKSNFIR